MDYLRSSLETVAIRSGFFTRKGGVSYGLMYSLNCSYRESDKTDSVRENRKRVSEALGFSPVSLVLVNQIHSADVVAVTAPFAKDNIPKADAMVTKTKGVLLGILTADCAPLLFADEKAGVIGAAHAGWQGAIAGVLENTLDAMCEMGAERERIKLAIGPTICQKSYEVDENFYQRFLKHHDAAAAFFTQGKAGHYQFDLPSYIAWRAARAGLVMIENVKRDTCAEEDFFFSHRRATLRKEADSGRQISVIGLAP